MDSPYVPDKQIREGLEVKGNGNCLNLNFLQNCWQDQTH